MMKTDFAVLAKIESGETTTYELVKDGLESTQKARRWMKKNLDQEGLYQIVSFRGDPIEVEIEEVKKRKLYEQVTDK